MSKNKYIALMGISGVLILGSLFYWYEWRPMQAKKECADKAWQFAKEASLLPDVEFGESHKLMYDLCLKQKGL